MKKISGADLARLTALRSVCLPGQGRLSQVFSAEGSVYDSRRVRTLLAALARHHAVDLVALRQRCGALLAMRNYLPLPLSARLVLAPLTLGQMGEKTGYVNMLAVERIVTKEKYCRLFLTGGAELDCWLSASVVQERLLRAKYLLYELSAAGLLPAPQTEEMWRQKLEIIRTILE